MQAFICGKLKNRYVYFNNTFAITPSPSSMQEKRGCLLCFWLAEEQVLLLSLFVKFGLLVLCLYYHKQMRYGPARKENIDPPQFPPYETKIFLIHPFVISSKIYRVSSCWWWGITAIYYLFISNSFIVDNFCSNVTW